MSTASPIPPRPAVPPGVDPDVQAVAEAVAAGRPVDPAVAKRVRERADKARAEAAAVPPGPDLGVQIIREARGPVDADQDRELTLAQRDLLRRGQLRLTDPDTGTTYVLVPEDEFDRLRGAGR